MSREVYRVPLDFDWPLNKVWEGYLWPDKFNEDDCTECDIGYSPEAERWYNKWYGKIGFHPSETGSTPWEPEDPEVWAFAERNVGRSPDFYGGTSENHIWREALRLSILFNEGFSHHLDQDDVDALVKGGRLMDFTHQWDKDQRKWVERDPKPVITAKMVNSWSIAGGIGHDSINCSIVVSARAEREGANAVCQVCHGHGSLEAYPGQREEAEKWDRIEPPKGEGFQLWETVSEGSPISPVFPTKEDLANWLHINNDYDYNTALRFVEAGWGPSGVLIEGVVLDAVEFAGADHGD